MKPYIVALLFRNPGEDEGMLVTNAIIAPTPHAATAMLATQFVRQTGTDKALTGAEAVELTQEFLRAALNPGGAKVVNLSEVPREPAPEPASFVIPPPPAAELPDPPPETAA